MEKLIKYSNGQWSLVKAAPNIDKGHSVFNMDHVNKVVSMKDVGEAKKFAHDIVDSSNAIPRNKLSIKKMINDSRNIKSLALGMSNHILAHPSVGLKVIKEEGQLRKANGDGKKKEIDAGSDHRLAQKLYGSVETPAAETPAAEIPAKNKNEKLYHVKHKDGGFLTEHPTTESRIRVWHGDKEELENKNLEMVPMSSSHKPYTNHTKTGPTYHVTKDGEALTNGPTSIYDIMYGHPDIIESMRDKPSKSGLIPDFIAEAKDRGINIHEFSQGQDDAKKETYELPVVNPHLDHSSSAGSAIASGSESNAGDNSSNRPKEESWYGKHKGGVFTTGVSKDKSSTDNLESMKGKFHVFRADGTRVTKEPLTDEEIKAKGIDSPVYRKKPVYQETPATGSRKREREEQKAKEESLPQRVVYERYNRRAFIHNNPSLTPKEAREKFNKLSDEEKQKPFRPEDHVGKPYVDGFEAEIKSAKIRGQSKAQDNKSEKSTTGNKQQELDAAALQRQLQEYAGKPVPNEKPKRPKIFDSLDIDKVSQIMKNHGNSPEALSRSKDVAIGKLQSLLKDETISNNDFAYWRQAINNATDAKRVYDLMFNHINRK